MEYKIKIVLGFKTSQEISVPAEEAHKAYYLFRNPNERGVFDNGLAIRGMDIQRIEPDYQGTMGWNPTHVLDTDDWNEIRDKGIDRKMREITSRAGEISKLPNANQLIFQPLSKIIHLVPSTNDKPRLSEGIKSIGEIVG